MIKTKKHNLIWLLPLGALLLAFYLAYQKLSQVGERITLYFRDASGLEVDKTRIRYKNMNVGVVTKVNLSENLDEIIVEAQMHKSASALLRADTEFWVVSPQVSIAGISGLNTLLSGSYIALSPGQAAEYSTEFKALTEIPIIEKNEEGRRIQLLTDQLHGLKEGSAVYYHGMKVGVLEKIAFSEDYRHLLLTAFIQAPYDNLIRPHTRFWNASGFKANLTTSGANIEVQSLESLIFGGISFNTPQTLIEEENDAEGMPIFTLYRNENATDSDSKIREYYVLYFSESVRGLKVGAAVNFNGIDVGSVSEIRLIYDSEEKSAKIPVLINIEPERITRLKRQSSHIISEMVLEGLSASLENGNLLTGEKYIKLSMQSESEGRLLEKDSYSQYYVLPTNNSRIVRITDDLGDIIATVKNMPLKAIAENVEALSLSLRDSSQELRQQLSQTLQQFNRLLNNSDKNLNGLTQQIKQLSRQLEKTLKGVDPNSSFYFTLEQTLKSLEKTSNALQTLLRKLNQKPNALIFGDA